MNHATDLESLLESGIMGEIEEWKDNSIKILKRLKGVLCSTLYHRYASPKLSVPLKFTPTASTFSLCLLR